jgi:hypothetical protein
MQARSQVAGGRLLPTWPLLPLAAADVGRRASQGFRSRGTTSRLQAAAGRPMQAYRGGGSVVDGSCVLAVNFAPPHSMPPAQRGAAC